MIIILLFILSIISSPSGLPGAYINKSPVVSTKNI